MIVTGGLHTERLSPSFHLTMAGDNYSANNMRIYSFFPVNEHLMQTNEVQNQFNQQETNALMFLMNSRDQQTQVIYIYIYLINV